MKTKITKELYDEATGITTVELTTDYGKFIGTCKLHEEDRDKFSNFCGYEYAEIRALIKYVKKRIEVLRYKIKGLTDYYNVINNVKDFNSYEKRRLEKHINILQKEQDDWKNRLVSLQVRLNREIHFRDEFLEKITRKKSGQ